MKTYIINNSRRQSFRFYAIFLMIFLIYGCSSSKTIADKIGEDFDQFYDRFHEDVDFQMERIAFPLKGGMEDNNGRTAWTPDNWIPLKVKIQDVDTSTYRVEYNKSETGFTQKFWLPGSGFSSEYHFKKMDGKWFLVFAEDVNL